MIKKRDGETTSEYKARWQREWRIKNPIKAREQDRMKREKYKERRTKYLSEYLKTYDRDEKKMSARIELNNAVRSGKITRPEKCSDCGKRGRIEAHHEDYSRALDVDWLCSSCHGMRDNPPQALDRVIEIIKEIE